MPRVVKTRLFVVNVPPGIPVEKIYERLASAVRSGYAEISIKGGKAYITVAGTESQIRETWASIKNALSQLWSLHRLLTSHEAPVEAIVREAGRTFPPEALVEALRLRGYRAELSSDKETIYTDAPPELVIDLARAIAGAMDEMRFRVKGTAAKRMIAALAAGLGVDVETVIEYGLRSRVLVEAEDGVRLREEWRRGLRKLALALKGPEALAGLEQEEGGRSGEDEAAEED